MKNIMIYLALSVMILFLAIILLDIDFKNKRERAYIAAQKAELRTLSYLIDDYKKTYKELPPDENSLKEYKEYNKNFSKSPFGIRYYKHLQAKDGYILLIMNPKTGVCVTNEF